MNFNDYQFVKRIELISYALVVLAIAGATWIPTYVALYFIANLKIPTKYLALLGTTGLVNDVLQHFLRHSSIHAERRASGEVYVLAMK
jgi:hypothetical protein